MQEPILYLSGRYLPQSEASLPITELAFLRGYAAFELLRTYKRKLFRVEERMARLENSCHELYIPFPDVNWNEIFTQLLNSNPTGELAFRIYITGGPEESELANLIILVQPIPEKPPQESIALITTSKARSIPEVKSTQYGAAMASIREARTRGADDALFLDPNQNLLELTRSNFFAFIDDKLITPPPEKILPGLTRTLILNLASELSIPTEIRRVHYSEIPQMQEAFATGTVKEILPIRAIDQYPIPLGDRIEPLRKALHNFTDNA